jgi:hypothetical protein
MISRKIPKHLLIRIFGFFGTGFAPVEKVYGIHPVVGQYLVRTDTGPNTAKHLSQASSILNIMEKENLFQDDTCYIEFGSGRGIYCIQRFQ